MTLARVSAVQAAYEDMLMFKNIASMDWQPFKYIGMLETEDKDHGGPQKRRKQIADQLDCNPKQAATKAKVIMHCNVQHY